MFKKIVVVSLVIAMGLAFIPLTAVQAADEPEGESNPIQPDNHRLERAWFRAQGTYQRAMMRLDRSDEFISLAQQAIDRAGEKGWDTSALQAALASFAAALQDARPILNSANGIINAHKGFDATGQVVDRDQAIETLKELAQHLKDARDTMSGTGQALREALRAFREAHRPNGNE